MLTSAQIEQFKRDGALTLRGFFSPDEIGPLRDDVVRYFGDPRTPGEWSAAVAERSPDGFDLSRAPTVHNHRGLAAVFGSLHEHADWQGANQLLPRAPLETREWSAPRSWHVDFPGAGLVPVPPPVRLLAHAVIYLNDVAHRGGAFTFLRGSHHVTWGHFRAHPDDYCAFGARRIREIFDTIAASADIEPEEFVGNAGDVMVHHSMLLHSSSMNASAEARLGLFSRWGTAVRDGDAHYDFSRDMWAHWRFRAQETVSAGVERQGFEPVATHD